MANTLLVRRMLNASNLQQRTPWRKCARVFGASIVGLATLLPIHAYSSNPAVVTAPAQPVKVQTFSSTQIIMDINGDKIQFSGGELTPTTPINVNGVAKYFGDLTPKQQAQLREAMAAVPALPPIDIKSIIADQLKQGGKSGVKVFTSQQISMDINGSKIELNTTDLTPTTPVKVNGVVGRFGDLTSQQQQQIRERLPKVDITNSALTNGVLTPRILNEIVKSVQDIDLPENIKIEVMDAMRAEAAKP